MLEMPLKVGVLGAGPLARGVALQIEATHGMDLAWQCKGNLEDLKNLLKNTPIDVFVEASHDLSLAAESSLLAIENHAHIVLTDPRIDVTIGLTLQAIAYQNGIIVTSDAGTPHGTLATMIQEAHIMGFETLQAGQICPQGSSPQLQYEMAALANGFGFLPPEGGMTGPKIDHPDEIITAFDLDSYGDTPRIDFAQSALLQGLYLIVKAKGELSEEQANHLRDCQLGDGPSFLFHRNPPLGFFETPKAILGAAAGQPILAPGIPTCDVYAQSLQDLKKDSKISPLESSLLPLNENLIPHALLQKDSTASQAIPAGSPLTFENLTLPDSPLTQLWAEQQKIRSESATFG